MIPERWQRVKTLLDQALQLPPEQRPGFLDAACVSDAELRAEIETLLAEEVLLPSRFLASQPHLDLSGEHDTRGLIPDSALQPGQRFAERFVLVRKLGEGGMGQVWLAEQTTPVRRQVALKLIRAGMYDESVVQRFQSERQSLAMMDHPAIAKVLDAGATPLGQPYFVMEYVAGLAITEYCDQKKRKIRDRLEILIQACEGVQHAHQKAIIHRDLKPANILVTEVDGKPVARIIDFGLAKATTPEDGGSGRATQVGHFLGTPGYMSPEQADPGIRDVDTRSDVYSLGVVLYELLTGLRPYDGTPGERVPLDELLRKLRQEEPPSPSHKLATERETASARAEARGTEPRHLLNLLRGDLDWIALKALEKERQRRYESVSALAADLRRYLNHEAVVARPATRAYRLGRYVRRNRVPVAVAAGLLLLLAAFSIVQGVELRRITRERDRANRERDRATRITDFMTTMFKVSDPNEARGNSVTAREILDATSGKISTGLAKDPATQAQMMEVMGVVYQNLGLYSRADPLLRAALDLRRRTLGAKDPDVLQSMDALAVVLGREGKFTDAIPLLRETVDGRRQVLGPGNPDTLTSILHLANYLDVMGNTEEAVKLEREIVDARRRVLGAQNLDTVASMQQLAMSLLKLGENQEAEKLLLESLEVRRKVQGRDHPAALDVESWLGKTLTAEGRSAEAEGYLREAADTGLRVLGPDHNYELGWRSRLAANLQAQGRCEEAATLEHEVVDGFRRVMGPDNFASIASEQAWGAMLACLGRYAEEVTVLQTANDSGERTLGPKYPLGIGIAENLALALTEAGKAPAAETLERQKIAAWRLDRGPGDVETLVMQGFLANTLVSERRYSDAESLARQTLDAEIHADDDTFSITKYLAVALAHEHRYGEAKRLLDAEIAKTAHMPEQELAQAFYDYACVASAAQDPSGAVQHLRDAVNHGYHSFTWMRNDVELRSLHADPRFQALLSGGPKAR